ncbi:transmembrane channel-like protein 3 [Cephus cinctus]|uniref:Transmembrane channel-like protein 3 n=1 Tax=Cephus cinctus TaxID=211228 RepID=A0AAJ7W5Z1_CEPCN|nr:transmembrane channel-like protein 3 [Cephus cinctus]
MEKFSKKILSKSQEIFPVTHPGIQTPQPEVTIELVNQESEMLDSLAQPGTSSAKNSDHQFKRGRSAERTRNKKSKEPGTPGILRVDSTRSSRYSSSMPFLSPQVEPSSPQPSVDRLSVTFAIAEDKTNVNSEGYNVNFKTSNSLSEGPTINSGVEMQRIPTIPDTEDGGEDEDYSASACAIIQRRASSRCHTRRKRRSSSPFSPDAEGALRRRSSAFTTSSGENVYCSTAISIEDGGTQEQIFENLKLHKEVLSGVRQQPWPLRRKMKLVQQAKSYVRRHEGALQERLAQSRSTRDVIARASILINKKWQYFRREIVNLQTWLIPWELRIKEIESHFGSAVASYFIFLRWLFWINLVISATLTTFVAIPEVLTANQTLAGERKVMLPEEKLKSKHFLTLWEFEGILKYSPFFYGWYTNQDSTSGYRLPLAYFVANLVVYTYSFVAILRKMAENSRMSKLSEKEDECAFSWKLFTGWDFMIGNPETAHNRIASIVLGFKEALLEEAEKEKDERNWKIISMRIFVNICVMSLLALSAYEVVVIVARSMEPEAAESWWRQNEITVIMSLITFIFPFFFEILGIFENYHPRKQLRIQLARIMLLNLLNMYSLIFALFDKISNMEAQLQNLKPNSTIAPPICRDTLIPCYTNTTNSVVTLSALSLILLTNVSSTGTTNGFLENNANGLNNVIKSTPSLYDTTALNRKKPENLMDAPDYFNGNDDYNNVDYNNSDYNNYSYDMNNDDEYNEYYDLVYGNATTEYYDSYYYDDNDTINIIDTTAKILEDDTYNVTTFTEIIDFNDTSTFDYNSTDGTETMNDYSTFSTITSPVTTSSATDSSTNDISTNTWTTPVAKSTSTFDSITDEVTTELIASSSSTQRPVKDTTVIEKRIVRCYKRSCESPTMSPETSMESTVTVLLKLDNTTRRELRRLCWETMFGQELAKLTVMDLILTILSTLGMDFARAVFVRFMNNCWCWDLEKQYPQYGDFKIAENILHLVNNQGMVWMGMFFSPGLAALNLLKLGILMYLRSWAVLTCNVPHEVVFRASRSNNFYLALLLTMLFLCVLPVGYAIVWVEPSWHCGPFAGHSRMYHLATHSLKNVLPATFHKCLDYIASPGIIIPLIVLMALIIYYMVSLTGSLREANNDLKIQLRQERTEERRKMFQRAEKRQEVHETPFVRWKKILPVLPSSKSADIAISKGIIGNVVLEHKERKRSATSEAEEATDIEQDSLPHDPALCQQDLLVENNSRHRALVKQSSNNRSFSSGSIKDSFEQHSIDYGVIPEIRISVTEVGNEVPSNSNSGNEAHASDILGESSVKNVTVLSDNKDKSSSAKEEALQ